MSNVQILVGQSWQDHLRYFDSRRPQRPSGASLDLSELRDIVDIVVDGRNLTASIPEESIFDLLDQLLQALLQITEQQQPKAIVDFHREPWELALVADGPHLLISLYSIDRRRLVIARDLPADLRAFADALLEATQQLLTSLFRISDHFSTAPRIRQMSQALATLKKSLPLSLPPRPSPPTSNGNVQAQTSGAGLTLRYDFDGDDPNLHQYNGHLLFDLHSLLVGGHLSVEIGDHRFDLSPPYPFLVMQALLDRTRQLLHQLETNAHSPFTLSDDIDPLPLTIEGQGSRWKLIFQTPQGPLESTHPPATTLDLFLSIVELFVQDLLRLNADIELNQRFDDLSKELEKLRRWHRDLCGTNNYLDDPQRYLEELGHLQPGPPAPAPDPSFPWPLRSVHTLFPRRQWSFQSPDIDFSSLAIDDEGLLISTPEALHHLDLQRGTPRWSVARSQDLSHPGLISDHRLALTAGHHDQLWLIDISSGTRITSIDADGDWTALCDGAFYHDEDLGIAARRDGRIIAFGLSDGRLRWSFQMGPSGLHGLQVDGPLIIAQSREGVLSALNPLSGEVLWKVRIGGSPHLPPRIHQGRLYIMTQDPLHHGSTLYALYPLTGRTVWQTRLPGFVSAPLSCIDQWMLIPLERDGQLALHAIDLESLSPDLEWQIPLSSAGADHPSPVAPALIDNHPFGLIRTDRAELTCFDLHDGSIRWRSVPHRETLLLHGQLPLFTVRDAVINISDQIDLRHLPTGQLLHSLEAIEAPDTALVAPPCSLLLGERGVDSRHGDRITAFDIHHFLTPVAP